MKALGRASLCLIPLLSACSNADLKEALTSDVTGAEVACSFPKTPPALEKDAKRCDAVPMRDNGTLGQNYKLSKNCEKYLRWKANAGVELAKANAKYKARCVHKKGA